jgi:hypothetical protein
VKWAVITIAVVAVVPVLRLSTRRAPAPAAANAEPARSLSLTVTGDGGRLSLRWDREASAIRAGQCGVLWISDGRIHRRVILDASQLRAGKLFYWPTNSDVSFEIQMSEGNDRSGETVCGNNATAQLQPAEGTARREPRAERPAARNRLNTIYVAGRQSIESRQPEDVSGSGKLARIEWRNAPAFAIEGESQPVATLWVQPVQLQAIREKPKLSTAISPVPQGTPEPFSTVTVEAVPESRLSRIVGKIPLLRRLHRTSEFLPPRPVRETTLTMTAELRRTLKSEVPLDVRAYIDESGKVTYAEMLSNVTEADRVLASMAVFDARHWEFMPAQLGGHTAPGQVILHYRFGNPLLAISRDEAHKKSGRETATLANSACGDRDSSHTPGCGESAGRP